MIQTVATRARKTLVSYVGNTIGAVELRICRPSRRHPSFETWSGSILQQARAGPGLELQHSWHNIVQEAYSYSPLVANAIGTEVFVQVATGMTLFSLLLSPSYSMIYVLC